MALSAVRGSPDFVALGKDGRGDDRFTSQAMIETEQRLQRASELMAERERHRVGEDKQTNALARAGERGLVLSGEQRAAFEHVTDGRGLSVVVGYAGTGKSAMLGVAREAWENAGFTVRGAALSGIAAEGLEHGSGIASRTIASLEHQWGKDREQLTSRDVLVIDEAGMVGTRQMERVLSHAVEAGAKVVLVGDAQQLQAIEAGAAFRAIHERHGGVEISEVRRQHEGWQQDATRHLATGRTGQAIHAYGERGMVHSAVTREAAREDLIERWDRDRQGSAGDTRIILTHTNDEVRELNEAARGRMRVAGGLGDDVSIKAERGERQFASGDRIMFLRNERELGVKNGTLGIVEQVMPQRMVVRTDDGRNVAFDTKDYAHIDHGYAATIHKAQGMTVDRTHVLATPGMDSHGAYVALSRHRDGVALHYGRDDFADQSKLVRTLSRERGKDMASDYSPEQQFAERRGITFRQRIVEIARQLPERAKSIFANFRPQTQKLETLPTEQHGRSSQRHAVERFARAADDMAKMRQQGLPVLPHQRDALDKAGNNLDAIRPHAAADLASALQRQPELTREAADGRSQGAIRAMQLESEIRVDPVQRADRFVNDWQQLGQARAVMQQSGNDNGAGRIAGRMADMAKGLERDPQVESLLRNRTRELGLGKDIGRDLSRDLAASVSFERTRSIGMSL